MISQEVDELMLRGRRGSFLLALFTSPLNWMATLGAFVLTCVALAAFYWWLALLILAVSLGSAFWFRRREFERNEHSHFWNYLKHNWTLGNPPSRKTQQLIGAMIEIHDTGRGAGLLPFRPAVELVTVYEHQQQKLKRVEKRLRVSESLRSELQERLHQLQSRGENHGEGTKALHRAQEECAELEQVQGQL